MATRSRMRISGGGGNSLLGQLLLGYAMGDLGEVQANPNTLDPNFVGPPTTENVAAESKPFQGKSFMSRPKASNMNADYLMAQKQGDINTASQLKYQTGLTPELLKRERDKNSATLDFNAADITNKVNEQNALMPGKVNEAQALAAIRVLEQMGVIPSVESKRIHANTLTEPMIGAKRAATDLETAKTLEGGEQLKEQSQIRASTFGPRFEEAGEQAQLGLEATKGKRRYLPAIQASQATEPEVDIALKQRALNTPNYIPINERTSLFDPVKDQFKFKYNPYNTPGSDQQSGGYDSKVTAPVTDRVRVNPGTPPPSGQPGSVNKGNYAFDPTTGELVDLTTGKRIKTSP